MKLFKIFKEEIHPMEAKNPNSSIQTLIDGKRGVGFTSIDKANMDLIEKNNLKILPVRIIDNNTLMCVIYRPESKQEALQLYSIAKSNGGYLMDKNPEEAREIGKLLSSIPVVVNSCSKIVFDKICDPP